MTSTSPVGRLEYIPARRVWSHEALAFTPWLLDNEDVLASVLGMPQLRLSAAEHPVGGYNLDLIGTDEATGEAVIVENQLESSDHGHLGQLLTYAGGTDPTTVVWIAPAFRAEHRAALEWLNARTDSRTRFFAVQLEVVRIGESLPAPMLTLVVQPNDWEKVVKQTSPARTARTRWQLEDVERVLTALDPRLSQATVDFIQRYEASDPAASLYWGEAQDPSVTGTFATPGADLQPWSIFTNARTGRPVFVINFDWIHKSGRAASREQMEELVAELRDLPGVAPLIDAAREAGWRRRPSVPLDDIVRSGGLDVIAGALERLYGRLQAEAAPTVGEA